MYKGLSSLLTETVFMNCLNPINDHFNEGMELTDDAW